MRSILLAVVTSCVGAAEVPATPSNQVAAAPGPTDTPDLGSLRTLLQPFADARFKASAVGCPSTQTVGEYIAMLETNAAGHRLTGGCGPFPAHLAQIDPPAAPNYWYCRIDGFTNEGGDPWHYELRVRVRKEDRKVDLWTAGCPGTP